MVNYLDWFFCGLYDWIKSFFTPCCNMDSSLFGTNEFTGAKYNLYDWLWGTLYLLAKEYITVVLQLVLFSRIATTPDFLTGSLILFMMLVSFAFPFMSSYLFFVLRMGPFNKEEIVPYPLGLMRNLVQVILVVTAHSLAAFSAAQFLKDNAHQWQDSGLQMTMAGSTSMVSWLFIDADKHTNALPMAEEFLNTFVFLIGLIHLMAKHHPAELVLSAYFNVKPEKAPELSLPVPIPIIENKEDEIKQKTEEINKQTASLTETNLKILEALGELTKELKEESARSKINEILNQPHNSTLPPIRNLKPFPKAPPMGSFARLNAEVAEALPSNQRIKKDGTPYTDHIPIPIDFILHVCILLAATTRAFPTAHGTPAISLFMFYMGYSNKDVIQYRIGGGILGSLAALLYYYIWYVWPRHKQVGPAEEFVKRIIIAPPAFLYSELQLPNNMTGHYKNKV